ncbi:MAG: hypothetical protein ACRES9_00895 [Gammaproteobacteria bacterium]
MSALADVAAAGGKVWAEGDRLRYRLPKGRADLLAELKANKAEVLLELRAPGGALLERCRDACQGLPITVDELLAGMNDADKAAARSGDPDELAALRAFAECLAEQKPAPLDVAIQGNSG